MLPSISVKKIKEIMDRYLSEYSRSEYLWSWVRKPAEEPKPIRDLIAFVQANHDQDVLYADKLMQYIKIIIEIDKLPSNTNHKVRDLQARLKDNIGGNALVYILTLLADSGKLDLSNLRIVSEAAVPRNDEDSVAAPSHEAYSFAYSQLSRASLRSALTPAILRWAIITSTTQQQRQEHITTLNMLLALRGFKLEWANYICSQPDPLRTTDVFLRVQKDLNSLSKEEEKEILKKEQALEYIPVLARIKYEKKYDTPDIRKAVLASELPAVLYEHIKTVITKQLENDIEMKDLDLVLSQIDLINSVEALKQNGLLTSDNYKQLVASMHKHAFDLKSFAAEGLLTEATLPLLFKLSFHPELGEILQALRNQPDYKINLDTLNNLPTQWCNNFIAAYAVLTKNNVKLTNDNFSIFLATPADKLITVATTFADLKQLKAHKDATMLQAFRDLLKRKYEAAQSGNDKAVVSQKPSL